MNFKPLRPVSKLIKQVESAFFDTNISPENVAKTVISCYSNFKKMFSLALLDIFSCIFNYFN